MQAQLLELNASVHDLETAVLREGERAAKGEAECKKLEARQEQLLSSLRKAEKKAADADWFNKQTLVDLTQLVELDHEPSWPKVIEYVRARDERARQLGHLPDGEKADPPADATVITELTKQRNRLQRSVGQLTHELKLGKDRSRQALLTRGAESSLVLADKRELERENTALKVELGATKKKLRQKEERETAQDSGVSARPGALARAGTAQGGLRGALTSALVSGRPITAPDPTFDLMHEKAWMGEQLEKHAVENLRLREQLLFFTSKSAASLSRKKSHHSLTMPLPPV